MLSASIPPIADVCRQGAELPADPDKGVKYDSLLSAFSSWLQHNLNFVAFTCSQMDTHTCKGALVLKADAPGMTREDIKVRCSTFESADF